MKRLSLPALVLLAACGGGAGFPTAGPDRAATRMTDAEIRDIAEILRMEDHRNWDPAIADRLSESPSIEVRRRLVTAGGRIGDPAAMPLLTAAINEDPAAAVRADAAFALGELGDSSALALSSLRRAAPPDWAPVRPAETDVVVEVVAALGRIGSERARRDVADALRALSPIQGPHARRIAAEALLASWRFGDGPGRTLPIVPFLREDDPEIRWRAAYALMRMGGHDGARRLLGAFDDSEHRVRANAARALSAQRADSAGVRDSALVVLTIALDDSHPHVRINALRSLAGYGDDAPLDRMVARLADDPAVAVAAAGAIADLGQRAAGALAAAATRATAPVAVRAAAVAGVAALEPDRARPILDDWSRGDFGSRYAAARSLGALGWARVADAIERLARDRDPRVAVAAVGSAAAIFADSSRPAADRAAARSLLDEMAGSPDAVVQTAATEALRGGPESDTPARALEELPFYEDVVRRYIAAPLAGQGRPRAVINTAAGEIVVELLAEEAPLTVHNFATLAGDGFYDEGVWHRVVPNFVLQDGAPAGYPNGGPGWSIRDEINRARYQRGTMGMALSGPDTGGSQWFIAHSPQPHLDGGYTVFGRVVDGMETADRVLQGDPIHSIRIRP